MSLMMKRWDMDRRTRNMDGCSQKQKRRKWMMMIVIKITVKSIMKYFYRVNLHKGLVRMWKSSVRIAIIGLHEEWMDLWSERWTLLWWWWLDQMSRYRRIEIEKIFLSLLEFESRAVKKGEMKQWMKKWLEF